MSIAVSRVCCAPVAPPWKLPASHSSPRTAATLAWNGPIELTDNPPPRRATRWRRAWPAWVFLGAACLIVITGVAGNLPGLAQYRITTIAAFWGTACLVMFGLPLLIAWAAWSLLKARHWAARVAIYLALTLAAVLACLWLFVATFHPQM